MISKSTIKVLIMQASQGCAGDWRDFRLAAVPCIGSGWIRLLIGEQTICTTAAELFSQNLESFHILPM